MAKEKDGAVIERDTTTITSSRVFASKVRVIADRRGISMADVLDQYTLGIEREYRKVLDELNRELGDAGA